MPTRPLASPKDYSDMAKLLKEAILKMKEINFQNFSISPESFASVATGIAVIHDVSIMRSGGDMTQCIGARVHG